MRSRIALTALAVIVVAGLAVAYWHPWRHSLREFPAVDATGFTPVQQRLNDVLRAEHTAQAPGTKYSEGVDEDWCADFVSWALREAGAPLSNPNSASWRIPGVYTLEEYYRKAGKFAGTDYTPRFGDVIMYAPENKQWRQHTQFVIAVSGDTLTTIGGNQFGGVTVADVAADSTGIVGYGRT